MIESLVVTFFPVMFLGVLFLTGEMFRRRNVDVGGEPPIDKTNFLLSKYSIVLVWLAMVLNSWGIKIPVELTPATKWPSLFLWISGFVLLFLGRFGLGDSFRIGSPKEETSLRVDGLFSMSRNPMYLGVYLTLAASVLGTLNPLVLAVAIFIVAVHHKIVLAEEKSLHEAFGEEYLRYRGRVRRYL